VLTLQQEIKKASVKPLHASLFGSVARGTEQAGSDVDLLVVQPTFASEDERAELDHLMVAMVFAIDRTVDRDLRIVRLSTTRLERLVESGSMLLVDVLREGRTVWGPPLFEVLAPVVAAMTASSGGS
jgi:predicted nucleotidyltransferase